MYSSTNTTKELSVSLFVCFRIFTFGQIKMIFCGKLQKICFVSNANVYRYSNFIKTYDYFRTNCCLVINLKQNRLEIK